MEQRERATWDQALSEAVMWVVGDGALDRGLICREAMGSEGREMVESLFGPFWQFSDLRRQDWIGGH